RDLFGKITLGDRGRHLGDVADLARQVRGHQVDVVGQVLPGTCDPAHLGLTAELALGTDLACDAGHLVGEAVELIDHRIDGVLELEDLAANIDRDLFGEVAGRHRLGDLGDVADLAGQVAGHQV